MQKKVEEYSEHDEYPLQNNIQQKDQPQCTKRLNGISIVCSLCEDYLVHSVTTTCQHTFCELCLTEYMLYLDQCPQCCIQIRNQKQGNNILLDNLILEYIKKFDPEELAEYERRLQHYKDYKRRKTLSGLQIGMMLDVRGLDYVWCTGRVHQTITRLNRKYVIIKYDKGSNKKEEIIETSPRLAPRGFFTEREDIPKYQRGKLILKNPQEGIRYHLIPECEEQQQGQTPQKSCDPS